MALIDKIFRRSVSVVPADNWRSALAGRMTEAGVSVSPSNALNYTAVYGCVRILAESVAMLPLPVYRRLPNGGKERATDYPLYGLLHDAPNGEMTSFEFREAMMAALLLWGNAYAEIEYNRAGWPVALWPLPPSRVQVTRTESGQIVYRYQPNGGEAVWLPGEAVFHLRGLGNGLIGYSPIDLARQAIGLGLAAEEFGARFFSNDAQPGGVLIHPGVMDDEAYERLAESWHNRHSGLSNAHRTAILEEGMSYKEIGVPPDSAQFLETRKFQVQEIARIFRVPPHMLADLDRATFSNIEHQSIEFVVHSVGPWLRRWEQAIQRSLIPESDRRNYFAEFLVDGLLRGDIAARYQAYAVGRQNGWLSTNDIRELENMNPVEGGDMYLVPLNMMPADQVANQQRGNGSSSSTSSPLPVGGRSVEQRALRSVNQRRRLMLAHQSVFADVLARILRRESNDIRSRAPKILKNGGIEALSDWLHTFYDEHEEFTRRQMSPVMHAYIELVKAVAMEEIDLTDAADLNRFERSYLARYAARHAGRSLKMLMAALAEATADDATERLEPVFENWQNVRASGDAADETVRLGNATAKYVYMIGGIMALRWVTAGDNCPYCARLNGTVIPISGNFIDAGATFEVDGHPPLTPGQNIGHAPAHRGCDCMIVAA